MKLSERLARLGTETAFEVLVRTRALEAQGRSVIHLEIGEPPAPRIPAPPGAAQLNALILLSAAPGTVKRIYMIVRVLGGIDFAGLRA